MNFINARLARSLLALTFLLPPPKALAVPGIDTSDAQSSELAVLSCPDLKAAQERERSLGNVKIGTTVTSAVALLGLYTGGVYVNKKLFDSVSADDYKLGLIRSYRLLQNAYIDASNKRARVIYEFLNFLRSEKATAAYDRFFSFVQKLEQVTDHHLDNFRRDFLSSVPRAQYSFLTLFEDFRKTHVQAEENRLKVERYEISLRDKRALIDTEGPLAESRSRKLRQLKTINWSAFTVGLSLLGIDFFVVVYADHLLKNNQALQEKIKAQLAKSGLDCLAEHVSRDVAERR